MARVKSQKGVFYVGIRDPISLRRNILECVKDVVQSEQRFERYKQLRLAKIEETVKLKCLIREINMLVSKLKDQLPDTMLRAITHDNSKVVQSKKKLEPKKNPKSDLEDLEAELDAIEGKIDHMKKKR